MSRENLIIKMAFKGDFEGQRKREDHGRGRVAKLVMTLVRLPLIIAERCALDRTKLRGVTSRG